MSQPDVGFSKVEVMGHRTLYGYVREQAVAGRVFVRVDIPAADHPEAGDPTGPFSYSPMHAPESVFGITPIAAHLCVALAQQQSWAPVSRYDLPERLRPALPPAPETAVEEDGFSNGLYRADEPGHTRPLVTVGDEDDGDDVYGGEG